MREGVIDSVFADFFSSPFEVSGVAQHGKTKWQRMRTPAIYCDELR